MDIGIRMDCQRSRSCIGEISHNIYYVGLGNRCHNWHHPWKWVRWDGGNGWIAFPCSIITVIPLIFLNILEIRKVIYETAISKPNQRIEIIGIKTNWSNRRWGWYLNGMGNKSGWDKWEHVRWLSFERELFREKSPEFKYDQRQVASKQVMYDCIF